MKKKIKFTFVFLGAILLVSLFCVNSESKELSDNENYCKYRFTETSIIDDFFGEYQSRSNDIYEGLIDYRKNTFLVSAYIQGELNDFPNGVDELRLSAPVFLDNFKHPLLIIESNQSYRWRYCQSINAIDFKSFFKMNVGEDYKSVREGFMSLDPNQLIIRGEASYYSSYYENSILLFFPIRLAEAKSDKYKLMIAHYRVCNVTEVSASKIIELRDKINSSGYENLFQLSWNKIAGKWPTQIEFNDLHSQLEGPGVYEVTVWYNTISSFSWQIFYIYLPPKG